MPVCVCVCVCVACAPLGAFGSWGGGGGVERFVAWCSMHQQAGSGRLTLSLPGE